MKTNKAIGILLITGAVALFVPYIILTIIFDYPVILREDTGIILTRFHEGGSELIGVWWTFAMVGLPLFPAWILMGQKLEDKFPFMRWATTFGVIALVVQMLGLLRWTFVVPVLAEKYVTATNELTKESVKIIFQVIHQYGGVVLGEHIGQIFTIIWTIMIAFALDKLRFFPKWVTWFAYIASGIYLLAQAELFQTVIPGFPVWNPAGLIGSTLWLIWLIVAGAGFIRTNKTL